MREKTNLLVFFIFIIPSFLQAQDKLDLEELKAPTMPAATMIGTQLNEISRPKSLKTLETAIFTNFLDSTTSFKVPSKFGIEFSPFMLTERKNFNYDSYLREDSNVKDHLNTFWQNFAISIATTTEYVINDTLTSDALGFGFRSTILNGKVDSRVKNAYIQAKAYEDEVAGANTKVISSIEDYIDDLDQRKPDWKIEDLKNAVVVGEGFLGDIKVVVEKAFDQISETHNLTAIENQFAEQFAEPRKLALEELKKQLANIKAKRYGLRLDVNYATSLTFPSMDYDSHIRPRSGFWANLSYTPAKAVSKGSADKMSSNFEFIGLARLMSVNENFVNQFSPTDSIFNVGATYDFGLRAVYEKSKFSLELEYIYRINKKDIVMEIDNRVFTSPDNQKTDKLLFNLNFKPSDNIQISYTLGRNFDGYSSLEPGQIMNSLSLNLGFGGINPLDLYPDK